MVEEIRRTLRPGGLYILNVIDAGPRRLVRAELATLAKVFQHVAVIGSPDGRSGNHVLVASDRSITLPEIAASEGRPIGDVARFIRGSRPLRDDFAPADQLLTRSD